MTTPTAARDRARATGADLRAALESAAAWLSSNAERINALNVFPVPDGDTGTNMSMTLQAAVDSLQRLGADVPVSQVGQTAYEAAMLGARGNSGVILSQLLSGFAQALADAAELTPDGLANALSVASDVAYRGVSKPVEGTILTVAREAAAAAVAGARLGREIPEVLERALRAATDAVAATPTQLEVVDQSPVNRQYGRVLAQAVDDEQSTFGFCTEFLLRDCDLPVDEVKSRIDALGESVIAVGNADLLRVHVHTLRPGQALEFAVVHGTLVKVKVDNMQLQHEAFVAAGSQASSSDAERQQASSIGVIAVAAGEGLLKVFRSLGARVVHGGQTMNPSVQEILAAVNSSGYQELIILPNNSNIILTARRVQELTPHRLTVVPTETAPQGIGALLAFNFQADMQTNVGAMEQAARAVHTIEVTRSVRDADIDGVQVQSGDMLGIYDGHIVGVSATADDALLRTFEHAPTGALEIVTIYHGADATEADAHNVAHRIRADHPGLAVEVVAGGQPHYQYVVSLE
ncbi:MAG: DAK2 domain-containing protein [Chloroflexi bacterium]|nr:DAK2 domain-containing protein [Chloroflexota bacterium]